MSKSIQLAVLGAGSFGTGISQIFARTSNVQIKLYARNKDVVDHINTNRNNPKFQTQFKLSDNITATNSMSDALKDSQYIFSCIPTQEITNVLEQNKQLFNPHVPFINCSKGMIVARKQFISQAFQQIFGEQHKYGVLHGPSFAADMLKGDPTFIVLASHFKEVATNIQNLSNNTIRIYTQDDVIGTEIAGAMKNVIAIGAGIIVGGGYGLNTLTGYIVRATQEIQMFANIFGAKHQTFFGLAGIGDLILTSYGAQSRNRTFGERFGRGEKVKDIIASSKGVVEGLATLYVVKQFADEVQLKMPITETIYNMIEGHMTIEQAQQRLMVEMSIGSEFPSMERDSSKDEEIHKKTKDFMMKVQHINID